MANEKLKQNADKIDSSSRGFGTMLGQLDKSTKKFRSSRGSIIKSAKGNIFEFPVFMSSSIPLDYATATSSLLEQVYASYLQMAISINPVIDHTQAVNGLQFSGLRTDTNKYLEYTDTMWQHDACHAVYDNDDVVVEFNMLSYSDADAKVILEDVNYQPLEEFGHYFMEGNRPGDPAKKNGGKKDNNKSNDNSNIDVTQFGRGWYGGKKGKNTQQASSAQMNDLHFDDNTDERYARQAGEDAKAKDAALNNAKASEEALKKATAQRKKESDDLNRARNALERSTKQLNTATTEYDKLMNRMKTANDKEKELLRKEIKLAREKKEKCEEDKKKNELTLKKLELGNEKTKLEIDEKKRNAKKDLELDSLRQGDLANSARVKAPKVLSEKDMEKLNTMKPILMTVDLNVKSDTGTLSPVEYVVGVKTYNRLIDADIIPEVAEYPLKEMDRITRKAKWRAGELKFFSDIVFRIKEKKQTAVDAKDPKRKWYRRLYELAHMKGDAQTANIVNGGSVIASFLFDKQGKTKSVHGLVPNVSIVVSKSDVDICKMKTGIDLLNGRTAAKLCRELFLMSFVVIDVDAESIKVLLPELHNEYDVHSIASVNRQIASLDSSNKSLKAFQSLMAGR